MTATLSYRGEVCKITELMLMPTAPRRHRLTEDSTVKGFKFTVDLISSQKQCIECSTTVFAFNVSSTMQYKAVDAVM